ncbi:DUF1599 domain-containing protein [Candidatus Nomurabacteria bacterium]|nr:DUF1599 domain-containing protein [Candidatus Nomurabacteria bacterium]USN94606.1 MAG: DUF1599 domain-containing protein [Candidatus Nomurabacteria bacterium]
METSYRKTEEEISLVIKKCKDLFLKKNQDYGSSWRVMRLPSLTDQIFIKAQRSRTVEDTKENRVGESIEAEYIGMINYSIMSLIQQKLGAKPEAHMDKQLLSDLYDEEIKEIEELRQNKNHDYGEAWRSMRPNSFTDLILMKLVRIKQIEDNDGKTIASEGVRSGYQDIVNYCFFWLILTGSEK